MAFGAIEGKMGRGEAGDGGKVIADNVGQFGIGGRGRARIAADGTLIHEHRPDSRLADVQPVNARTADRLAGCQRSDQHIAHQRALARAGDTRDDGQATEGNGHVEIFQGAQRRATHGQKSLGRRAQRRHGHAVGTAEVATGGRVGRPQLGRRAAEDHVPAVLARARPDVDGVIGGGRGHAVMFDVDDRPRQVAEGGQ